MNIDLESFTHDMGLLQHVLLADNRVSQVLKLHCLTEVFVDRLLMRQLGCTEQKVADLDITYSKKLKILEAATATADEPAIAWLRKFNALRNKCAHRLSYQPEDSEIGEISTTIPRLKDCGRLPQSFDEHISYIAAFMTGYLSSMTHARYSLTINEA